MKNEVNLENYFNKDYFIGGTKSNYYNYGKAEDVFKRCIEIIQKYHPKRLLDVGCAYGYFVGIFRLNGVDAYGIDISDWAIENTCEQARGYTFKADIRNIPFPDNFFDLIVSWDTLEHIPESDISKTAKELNRIGKRQWHNIGTKKFERDRDKSHVTIKPLSWWKIWFPNADLIGSNGKF